MKSKPCVSHPRSVTLFGIRAAGGSLLLAAGLLAAAAACGCGGDDETGGGGQTTTTAGGGGASAGGGGGTGGGVGTSGVAVLQHHNSASRDGVYVDAAFSKAAAAGLHLDSSFQATIDGAVYAQLLYLEHGPGGAEAVYAVTEQDNVYALDAQSGAVLWQQSLGTPVALGDLPCGNIDPLGITGTPIIDSASRQLFVDAMTTPDGGSTKKHLIFALSVDDGSVSSGWPVDVSATVTSGSTSFLSATENERGALALMGGTLYVPYGGHYGDCGEYHGWLVGVPIDDPSAATGWAVPAQAGGIWAPSGVAHDGSSLYVATGNTMSTSSWDGGEAVLRLGAGPTFSGQSSDYFAPSNWAALDAGDIDLGGTGPVLFELPGASPAKLLATFGKNGVGYLLDPADLGGIGTGDGTNGEGLFSEHVVSGPIITAAVAYRTAQGSYLSVHGHGASCPGGTSGDLTTLLLAAGAPPSFATAWCADSGGRGSPMVTTTDGQAEAIVWAVGSESSNRLRGFDGDTGEVIFDGGGPGEQLGQVRRFVTPIAAGGRIYVGGDDRVYAFSL